MLVTSSLTAAIAPLIASLFPERLPRRAVLPAWTFTGVPMELAHLGIEIELVDVDPETLMLPAREYDADLIVPTHLFGNHCDVAALKRKNPAATIVDDAAHLAPNGRDLSCVAASLYSFHATKPLATGEGGAVAIPADAALAARFRGARLHGIDPGTRACPAEGGAPLANFPYDVTRPGWKANMMDLCAALGLSRLERLEAGIGRRRAIVERYRDGLAGIGIQLLPHQAGSSFHIAAARLDGRWNRASLMAALADAAISTSVHFTPLHRLTHWASTLFGQSPAAMIASGRAASMFPVAEENAERILSLPLSSAMSDEEVDRVVGTLRELAVAATSRAGCR